MMGTENELICSIKVGCACFIWITKLDASGASQLATFLNMPRSSPTLL